MDNVQKVCNHNLYFAANIKLVTSRRIRLMRHIASQREMGNAYRVLNGKTEKGEHLWDLGIDGKLL
jgi:hypothetical protein